MMHHTVGNSSSTDDVPTVAEAEAMPDLEEWLVETFDLFPRLRDERLGHDADGWYAELAGSEKCLALGHVPDADGEWDPDTHGSSWDGDPLCDETRYGEACVECEGECSAEIETPSIWGRPGVASPKSGDRP